MNAIDTNVLVRIIIQDDEQQTEKALEYVKKNNEVFINHVVLCEFSWVCMACYGLKKVELIRALDNILRTENFIIEASEIVWAALHEYKLVSADFSDCLIGACAHHRGYLRVGTFDKKASKSQFFELIKT